MELSHGKRIHTKNPGCRLGSGDSAIGLLTGAAPAQALPMIPLAPACSFNGTYVLNQSNGFRVEFPWNGATPSGTAIAYGNDQKPALTGPVTGGVTSANEVAVTIDWAGPSQGQYVGALDAGGNVRGGFTQDLGAPGSTATWDSVTPLKCVEAPRDGQGDVIGILRVGQVLKVAAPCPADGWCNFTDGTSAWGSFFKNN